MSLDQDTVLGFLLKKRGMLIGYINSIVRDGHLAEDVFQEVSLTAVKKVQEIPNEDVLPAWVRSTARFTALNALRKRQRRCEVLDDGLLDQLEEHWEAAEATQGSETAVEALRQCMGKLAPVSKQLVHLRYQQGISGKDLAQQMGKPLNTIYVGLTRVHRFLEKCVKQQLSAKGLSYAE